MNLQNAQGTVRSGPGLRAAVGRVGDRWSLLVVHTLLEGPRRWRDLRDALPGIAPNVLSDRLRRLERAAIVAATPYSERPPRVAYELTEDGRALAGVLHLLAAWGGDEQGGPPHRACGTPMEVGWSCPTCGPGAEDRGDEVTRV